MQRTKYAAEFKSEAVTARVMGLPSSVACESASGANLNTRCIECPPRNAIFSFSAGAVEQIAQRAADDEVLCSTCRASGQGAFALHAWMYALGIKSRSPRVH